MKYNVKNLLRISLVFFFMGAVFTNCGKEEETSEEIGSATIKGKAMANYDVRNDTADDGSSYFPPLPWLVMDAPPSGTKVHAWISTKDLVTRSSNSRTYERRYYEAEIDGSGNYEITVDANNKAVTVHLELDDFEEDFTDSNGDDFRKQYSAPDDSLIIRQGQVKVEDFRYN